MGPLASAASSPRLEHAHLGANPARCVYNEALPETVDRRGMGAWKTFFGRLTVGGWFAFLRITVGQWWIKSVLHKPLGKFVSGRMVNWSPSLADHHP